MIKNKYFHGAKISSYGVSEGFLDYQCMAAMAQAEFIDIYSEEYEDACWELYNGEDCYYYDSDGHTYDYECCIERIEELKDMIANARGEQDVSNGRKILIPLHITANASESVTTWRLPRKQHES